MRHARAQSAPACCARRRKLENDDEARDRAAATEQSLI
jgi:hypothetical protein